MKPGANDPCPCGSGRKYKKCCRKKKSTPKITLPTSASHLQTAVPSPTDEASIKKALHISRMDKPVKQPSTYRVDGGGIMTISKESSNFQHLKGLDDFITWKPLGESFKRRFIGRFQTLSVLSSEQKAFFNKLEKLARDGLRTSAEQGLAMLDSMSREDFWCFESTPGFQALFLQRLGRKEESLIVQFEQAFVWQDEKIWLLRGLSFVQWVQKFEHPEKRETYINKLQDIVGQHPSPPAHLVLAFTHWWHCDKTLDEEGLSFYQKAFKPKLWPWKQPKHSREKVTEWLALLADGFNRVSLHAFDTGEQALFASFKKLFKGFPWEKVPDQHAPKTFSILCEGLARFHVFDEIKQLCQLFAKRLSGSPHRAYWLGELAQHEKKNKDAIFHYQQVLPKAKQLTSRARKKMMNFFLLEGMLPDCRTLLDLVDSKHSDDLDILRFELWYQLLSKRLEDAFEFIKILLAKYPDETDLLRQWMSLLEQLEKHEFLEEELHRLISSSKPAIAEFARCYLGILFAQQERFEEALVHLKTASEIVDLQELLNNEELMALVVAYHGMCLDKTSSDEDIEGYYHRSLGIYPTDWTYSLLLDLLFEQERFEEADTVLEKALVLSPDYYHLRFARLQISLHYDRIGEIQEVLESTEKELFVEHEHLQPWLMGWIRVLVEKNSLLEAFTFTEEHLEDILKDEELAQIRKQLVKDFTSEYLVLQEQVGEQSEQLKKAQQTRELLRTKGEEHLQRRKLLHRILQEKTHLQSELLNLQQKVCLQQSFGGALSRKEDEKLKDFEKVHAQLLEALSSKTRPLLRDAELLWWKLEGLDTNDHGPVVLQLARVVEGELNRLVIDPLIEWALRQGFSIGDFPSLQSGRLKIKKNRLTLGTTTRVLDCGPSHQDPGDIVDKRLTSHQNKHREILRTFLERKAQEALSKEYCEYAQSELGTDLQILTQLRNQASHADRVISRKRAGDIRQMLFGNGKKVGMLTLIGSLAGKQKNPLSQ